MKKIMFTLFVAMFCLNFNLAYGQTLSKWTFESVTSTNTGTDMIISSGSQAADSGILVTNSAVSGHHTSLSTVWSNPVGNGSTKSVSCNNWTVGDYYQFAFSTINYGTITVQFDMTGSATGPRDFKVQFSTDGSSFSDIGLITLSSGINWSSGSHTTNSTKSFDLSTNADSVNLIYIRIIDNSTVSISGGLVGAGGTNRVDNFTVLYQNVLPVQLSSFTASTNSNKANLFWTTESEVNNAYFLVLRSVNNAWTEVGHVQGSGTTNTPKNYSFIDNNLQTGKYQYQLKQVDYNGNFEYFRLSQDVIIGPPNVVDLLQNFPNPFNPSTLISFTVAQSGLVVLKVYDILGRQVRELINGYKEAGYYAEEFKVDNLSSGIYFYALSTGEKTIVKKMTIVK